MEALLRINERIIINNNKELQLSSTLPCIKTLMYHRIDTAQTNPWSICVSLNYFEEQIKFLKNNFNVISSDGLIKQVTTDSICGDSICITFDDGYADNYTNAKPILEKYNCPATFFIPTAFIGSAIPFWWDELEIILLHSIELPGILLLEINGENQSFIFNKSRLTEKQLEQHAHWKWYLKPPTERCEIFLKIWKRLRVLTNVEIQVHMKIMRKWAGTTIIPNSILPMNDKQITDLSKNPLFTIGMHTHSHPDLEGKQLAFQMEEIHTCKKILETKFDVNVNCLAYPFGRYDNNTINAVKKIGIKACFTTSAIDVFAHSDMAIIGRYQVFDKGISTLKKLLKV